MRAYTAIVLYAMAKKSDQRCLFVEIRSRTTSIYIDML